MDDSIKKEFNNISVLKDIKERQKIIKTFETTGYIDRNNAINMIKSLQIKDSELVIATMCKQSVCGSVNLYQADNNLIIENLQFQVDFLISKLAKLNYENIK